MTVVTTIRRSLLGIAFLSALFVVVVQCRAQDRKNLESPVYRVSREDATEQRVALVDPNQSSENNSNPVPFPKTPERVPGEMQTTSTNHPLDEALGYAKTARDHIRAEISDYTCMLVKQESIDEKLLPREFIEVKVRNRKVENGEITVPFSVYLKFHKPSSFKGREVVYVEGQNNGKIRAHEGGFKGKMLPSVWLKPDGVLAMKGNRYPITELGLENLCVRLLERAPLMIDRNTCEVKMIEGAKLNGRKCTCFQVIHRKKLPGVLAQKIQVFNDDEYKVPVHYAAYDFPREEETDGMVLESYTYLNLQLNVGLIDTDFDSKNPTYNY